MKRRKLALLALGAACVVLLSQPLQAAEPNDKAALDLAREAIEVDYLGTNFVQAQQKLEQAVALCKTGCSPAVRAQVYRDLGVVVFTGRKDTELTKQHFMDALTADPRVALDRDLTTPELQSLFDEARTATGVAAPAPEAEPAPEPEAEEEEEEEEAVQPIPPDPSDCPPGFPGCDDPGAKDEALAPTAANWFSLGVQQDLMLLSAQSGACSADSDYQCFFEDDTFYDREPEDRATGKDGNAVGGGLRRATLRLLLGYDRFIGENLAVGARVGWAFGGGPAAPEGAAFLPFHGEARLTYMFGDRPLAASGLRGYVHLSGGVAQVDAEVPVKVYITPDDFAARHATTVAAWRKSGTGFVGLGGGLMYAISPNMGPFLDVRVIQLFALSGTAISPTLGFAVGF